jgi:fatty-acyl-CoA synthase
LRLRLAGRRQARRRSQDTPVERSDRLVNPPGSRQIGSRVWSTHHVPEVFVSIQQISFEVPLSFPAQLDLRVEHPVTADKVLLIQDDRTWTYRQYRDQSIRMAHFLLRRLGHIDEAHPGHVAMFLENHLELLALFGGCAYGGLTLFGINTGLRGDVLAGVINHARARVLVVDEKLLPEFDRVRSRLTDVAAQNILVLRTQNGPISPNADLVACVDAEVGGQGGSLEPPAVEVTPDHNLMVIYTSGTTGLPKGINNSHAKLLATGFGVAANIGLTHEDRGYACMPLFHSNSIFVGFMPAFWAGGSIALRERFSASHFVPDVLRYGVTFWNYVGEPVHYVLAAIEREYGGDEKRIAAEVTHHPRNKLRYASGNGASAPDIDRFMKWMGLEDMFELYGSTEAAISIFRRKGDPRGSVGEILDPEVQILNPAGKECPPAELGPDGQVLNYDDAVGEICRVGDSGLFQGYFGDAGASAQKFRDSVYHSGDLGHIVMREGKRYLYFDGRTDDWIRKDGENFSAAQVGRVLAEHPDVALVVVYGVPCPVSDELVMAALKLRPGASFDPKGFFDWCEAQVNAASMDRKWFPDFVRVVNDFEYTETQKVLVRSLKRQHFGRQHVGGDRLYWRRRGDDSFKPFTAEDYENLRQEFVAGERVHLLGR